MLSPVPNARSRLRLVFALVAATCVVGLLLRVYLYVLNRSFFLDEACLALNIAGRSYLGLLKPLDYNQGAPLGFLFLQKTVVTLLGNRDYILRLVPLLSGLISVPLMYGVARQYGGRLPALVSLGLFALSPKLIRYSSELKQYSTDVLAALVLLLVAPRCLEVDAKPRRLLVLGIAGSLAMWFSHSSLFVFSGILLSLGVVLAVRRDSHRLFWLIGMVIACGANLSLVYFTNLRYLESNSELVNFWVGNFAPVPPWRDLGWYFGALGGMLKGPAGLSSSEITLGLLTLGIFSLALKRWQFMLVLLAPFLMTLVASALRRYPFCGRLLLFLVPVLLLLLAEGVERARMVLLRVSRPLAGLVAVCLAAYLLRSPVVVAYGELRFPRMGEHIKPVMSYVRDNYLSSDQIYVYHGAGPAFMYYGPQYGFDRDDYVVGSRGDTSRLLRDIKEVKDGPRVWCVFAHIFDDETAHERDFILGHLDEIGLKRDGIISDGASAYLYDMGGVR
jgi:hypothetical protein